MTEFLDRNRFVVAATLYPTLANVKAWSRNHSKKRPGPHRTKAGAKPKSLMSRTKNIKMASNIINLPNGNYQISYMNGTSTYWVYSQANVGLIGIANQSNSTTFVVNNQFKINGLIYLELASNPGWFVFPEPNVMLQCGQGLLTWFALIPVSGSANTYLITYNYNNTIYYVFNKPNYGIIGVLGQDEATPFTFVSTQE